MVKFSRYTVSITKDLKKRMDAAPQSVNWSACAREAIEHKLEELDRARPKQTKMQQEMQGFLTKKFGPHKAGLYLNAIERKLGLETE